MNEKFNYTYSAPTEKQKREIEQIRRQYLEKENKNDDKFIRLKRLNSIVKNGATIVALILGVMGVLIFGTGMSLVLEFEKLVLGIVVACIGVIPIAIAAPVYNVVFKHNKKKYGEEILRLSEQLLNVEKD